MVEVSLALAFGAGLLSFFSPCLLPLVPAYLVHLTDTSLEASSGQRWRVFLHAVSFVLGFGLVFVALGAVLGLAGSLIAGLMPFLRKGVGVLLVAMGLQVAGFLPIPFLYREGHLTLGEGRRPGYLRSALMGVTFSLGWTPCVGPILGGILALAWNSQTVWQGAFLLTSYVAGLGLPFLIAGVALEVVKGYLRAMVRYGRVVSWMSGFFLVILGILIFTDSLTKLSPFFDFFGLGKGI